jgi:fructose-1,6-bisphosphatase II
MINIRIILLKSKLMQTTNLEKYLSGFINSCELSAIECSKFIGLGDKIKADEAATTKMREILNLCEFSAVVKTGEGEMDEAPMLFNGEKLGTLKDKENLSENEKIDIAVDPLEGTNLCANGYPGSLTTICFSSHNSILKCPDIYMEKLIVRDGYSHCISLESDIEENLKNLAKSMKKPISDLKIIVLNRERHQNIIEKARKLGARVLLINDGDIMASLNVYMGFADMYCGIGGSPEGILSAACAKSFANGEFFGRLIFDEKNSNKIKEFNIQDPNKIYTSNDLIKNDCIFIASAVTYNDFMKGVEIDSSGCIKTETFICSSIDKSFKIIKSFRPSNIYYE